MIDTIWKSGPLDVLVNNAAGNFIARTEELSPRAWDSVIGIVLLGTLHATMACGRRWLKSSHPGTVLSISATYAPVGSAYVVPSAVSKAGVEALTRSLAVEWGNRGIRMNAIAPGPIPTQGAFSRVLPRPALEVLALDRIPMHRFGTKEELANLAAFLISDGSSYINGEVIRMDGGEFLQGAGEFSNLGRALTERRLGIPKAPQEARVERAPSPAAFDLALDFGFARVPRSPDPLPSIQPLMEVTMYVILGASGNTGQIVAQNLLARQQKVRVVGRNADHLQSHAAQGAEIFIGDVTDAVALTKALNKADSAYVMIPPNPTSNDPLGYEERAGDAIAAAIKNSGIKNVVSLSSIGADKNKGTGPVIGLHNLEQKLNQIDSANVLHLRPGYFMENTLPQVGAIRMAGSVIGPIRPDLKLPMIATRDIGAAAADALLGLAFRGKQTHELLGQRDLDYTEIATIIGKAIGKPDLGYVNPPNDQIQAAMVQMGMSAKFVELLLEMAGSLNSGYMRALEPRTSRNTTPTSYETFVADSFVPAYQQQTAA